MEKWLIPKPENGVSLKNLSVPESKEVLKKLMGTQTEVNSNRLPLAKFGHQNKLQE